MECVYKEPELNSHLNYFGVCVWFCNDYGLFVCVQRLVLVGHVLFFLLNNVELFLVFGSRGVGGGSLVFSSNFRTLQFLPW